MTDSASVTHTILVIDDDVDVREVVGLLLEQRGYRVVHARDGRDALSQLRTGLRPSLIILDVMMPGMDGFAFREAQLADHGLAGIPAIIYSAAIESRAAYDRLRPSALASKMDTDALCATVATLLASGRALDVHEDERGF